MKKIAILCSGGDVSGMNPALKRFVEYTLQNGLEPYFVQDGFEGLIDNSIYPATHKMVAGIINRGGTIIGSSRSKRFFEPNFRKIAKENLDKHNISMLVVLGGDGSFRGLNIFYKEHKVKFCAIPSTIDNDIKGTNYALGVDTALNVIKDAIDNIRDTASSFKRAFVVETMGRECGYLAQTTAMTCGAELCLIPEVPFELKTYEKQFKDEMKNGRKYFIAVVSEGVKKGTSTTLKWFEEKIGIEARAVVLGHIQRGGNPTTYDRLMAYKFVTYAIDALLSNKEESVIYYTAKGFDYMSLSTTSANLEK